MANRSFHKPLGSLEIDTVALYATATIGASGAVSSYSGKGVTSVTRDSTGQYKVNLSDSYNAILWADVQTKHTTGSDPATVGVHGRWEDEDVDHSTAPYVQFQMFAGDDGAAADPASGAVLYFKIELRNSSVS